MDVVSLVTGSAAILLAIAIGILERRKWLPHRRGRRVIVHDARDNVSIEGVLVFDGADGLVLRTAKILEGGGTELKGETFVPRDRVSFIQAVQVP